MCLLGTTQKMYLMKNLFLFKDLPSIKSVENARCLLLLGDSVTTDHISPAGSIARNSPAARFLASRGLTPREFNSYGSRRGNDAIMSRGTFANIRIVNKMVPNPGPRTKHHPSGDLMDIYDAAERGNSVTFGLRVQTAERPALLHASIHRRGSAGVGARMPRAVRPTEGAGPAAAVRRPPAAGALRHLAEETPLDLTLHTPQNIELTRDNVTR
ncbi:hypothetical protein evm_014502, partial [Chilo suppressalis]